MFLNLLFFRKYYDHICKLIIFKHFYNEDWPTEEYPDPVDTASSAHSKARKPPKKRIKSDNRYCDIYFITHKT